MQMYISLDDYKMGHRQEFVLCLESFDRLFRIYFWQDSNQVEY